MGSTLRDRLNRARWRDGDLNRLFLVVVHRGAPDDRRRVPGERVTRVLPTGVEVTPETGTEPTFLPYHRFLAVEREDGEPVWLKKGAAASPNPGHAGQTVAASSNPPSDDHPERDTGPVGPELRSELHVRRQGARDSDLLVLDGSAGEGGGQIVRTSLTLSMLTGRPFALERVRAGRKKPGLMRQHLTALRAAQALCGAQVEGATLGSSHFVFRPGPIRPGDFDFDIGTAGSISLVLQTLALPLTQTTGSSLVHLRGGTHAKWAPIAPFLEHAWLPYLQRMGAQMTFSLQRAGFYPAGGGEVLFEATPTVAPSSANHGLAALHLSDKPTDVEIELCAAVSNLPEKIARRELLAAEKALLTDGHEPKKLRSMTLASPGPGTAIWLHARDPEIGLVNVFSAIGDRGVSAEQVGKNVAEAFLAWRKSETSVEKHLTDQLMIPIALAGGGSFTCSELSLHAWTNIDVIDAFLGRRLRVYDLGQGRFLVLLPPPPTSAQSSPRMP